VRPCKHLGTAALAQCSWAVQARGGAAARLGQQSAAAPPTGGSSARQARLEQQLLGWAAACKGGQCLCGGGHHLRMHVVQRKAAQRHGLHAAQQQLPHVPPVNLRSGAA
jgi:hypothetical protein